MNFEEALTAIDQQKIVLVKVLDFKDNRILTVDETSPNAVIEVLRSYKDTLASYGKVTFVCSDEKVKRSNNRDAAHLSVTFSHSTNNVPVHTTSGIPTGYISASEAMLKAELEAIKKEREFDKKLLALETKLGKKVKGPDDFLKYLPLLPLVMDIAPEKIAAINSIGNLMSAMNGTQTQQSGISGPEQKNKVEVQHTDDEEKEWDEIEEQIRTLSEKIELKNIKAVLVKINEKPELLNTLMSLADNFK